MVLLRSKEKHMQSSDSRVLLAHSDADFCNAPLPCILTQSRLFSTFSVSFYGKDLSLCWATASLRL